MDSNKSNEKERNRTRQKRWQEKLNRESIKKTGDSKNIRVSQKMIENERAAQRKLFLFRQKMK